MDVPKIDMPEGMERKHKNIVLSIGKMKVKMFR
jgi:hypothetical protein